MLLHLYGHLYVCLPATGPYICYLQRVSMLLEGKVFVLKFWQNRLSISDRRRGSSNENFIPSCSFCEDSWAMLTLGVRRGHKVFNLTVKVWTWNSGWTKGDEKDKVTCVAPGGWERHPGRTRKSPWKWKGDLKKLSELIAAVQVWKYMTTVRMHFFD